MKVTHLYVTWAFSRPHLVINGQYFTITKVQAAELVRNLLYWIVPGK